MKENRNTEKRKKGNWGLFWRFLKGSRGLFLAGVLCSAAVSLADMVSPQIIKDGVDTVLSGSGTDRPQWVAVLEDSLGLELNTTDVLLLMAAVIMLIALLRAAAQYGVSVFNNKGSETLVKTIRDSVFSHIERLPFSWHMKNHTGDIIQRCTSDVEKIRNFVSEQLYNVIRIIILIIFAVAFMLKMNPLLTLIAVCDIPVLLWYAVRFGSKMHEGFEKCDAMEGRVSAMVQENLTGVRVVRAFAKENYERERFRRKNGEYTQMWVDMGTTMSRYFSTQDALTMLQQMLVLLAGSAACVKGRLTAGELIAFLSYNAILAWPIRRLGRVLIEMSKADVSIDRIAYIMNAEAEKEDPDASEPPINRTIEFHGVSFAYENCPEILHDIGFSIEPGQTLGILGSTGSGKSTLMLLLDKMYELPEGCGSITIGGVDIRRIRTEYLRRNISIVLQEPFLFSRSIADNIGIAQENLTLESIREAAKAACLDDSIQGFGKGYDTFVGERGVTLSGGQKQRAAIARALMKDAPIMIFDDSLSAVDTETDAKIREELSRRFGRATTILISHRLTTLSKADKVIVLSNGRIAEMGTPEELKTAGGIYQQIYDIQSGSTGAQGKEGGHA